MSKPTSFKLNANASTFSFNPSAVEWSPGAAPAAAPAAADATAALVTPVVASTASPASGPAAAPLRSGRVRTTSLNKDAQEFVFNTAIPAFTPASPAPTPAEPKEAPPAITEPSAAPASIAQPAAAAAAATAPAPAAAAAEPIAAPAEPTKAAPIEPAKAAPVAPKEPTPAPTPTPTTATTTISEKKEVAVSKPEPTVEPTKESVAEPSAKAAAPAAESTPTSTSPKANDTTAAAQSSKDDGDDKDDGEDEGEEEQEEEEETFPTPVPDAECDLAKRKYSRAFMLQFRPIYTTKPPELPDVEAVIGSESGSTFQRTQPKSIRSLGPGLQRLPGGGGGRGGDDGWRTAGGGPRGGGGGNNQQGGGRGGRNVRDQGRGGGGRRGQRDEPMDIEVKALTVSKNRYVKREDVEGDEKILREMKGVLNKLTPEKFDTLILKVLDLEIDSVNLLRKVVNAVFEKALAEPGFSPVYADFCVKVGSEKSLVDDEGQTQTFKRLILNQCQSEFEQEGTLAVDSALTDAERVVAIARQKQRMLGMIRFIGELFIRDMIKVGIMNICVQTLLGNVEDPVEESLEALCKLLITVGAAMEKKKQKELGMTFEELGKLSSSKKISSRLRFMVQDIIDLRRDGWKGRLTADINLKKLGKQGTDDAGDAKRQDARTKRAASDNMRAPAALMGGKRVDRFAAPNRTPTKEEVDDDGFSTAVGKKGKFGKQPVVAATEDTRPGAVSDIPIPSGRKGGSAHAGTSPAGTPNGKGNGGGKYMPSSNAQAKEEEEAKKKKKKPTAREMGGGSSFGLLLSSSDDEDKAESSDEEEDAEEDEDGEAKSPVVDKEEEDRVKEAVLGILKEYLRTENKEEALQCIAELGTKSMHALIVGRGVDLVLEKSDKERALLSTFFKYLAEKGVLTSKHFEAGFMDVLEFVEDLIIDIPLCVDILAALFSPLMCDGTLSFAYLGSGACEPIKASGKLAKLAKLVFESAAKAIGEEQVFKMVNKADLDLCSLSKGEDLAYLKDLPFMML